MKPKKYCLAADCRNNERNSNCQFFSVPSSEKDSERRQKWLTLLGREDLLQKNVKKCCYFVCCAHFDPSVIKIRKTLDLTAVPTVPLPDQPQHSQQEPSCSKSQPIVVEVEGTDNLLSKSEEGNMSSNSEEIENKDEVIVTKNIKEELASTSQHYSEYGTTQSGEEYHHLDQNKEQSDDSRSSWADTPITVKVEVDEEDEFDGDDHPEKRKRTLDEDPIGVLYTKKLKLELDPLQSIQPQCSTVESPQVPSKRAVPPAPPKPKPQKSQDSQFLVVSRSPAQNSRLEHTQTQKEEPTTQQLMSVVEQNQKEILKLLKEQTLLQDPDPELHMFLKLLGAKLQRLQKKKQHEIQSKIMELLSLE